VGSHVEAVDVKVGEVLAGLRDSAGEGRALFADDEELTPEQEGAPHVSPRLHVGEPKAGSQRVAIVGPGRKKLESFPAADTATVVLSKLGRQEVGW
jgi:hypothetical protein